MRLTETVFAYGHENVQATHKTTLEITKEKHLSKKGDCIIAVSADKALPDLAKEFREKLQKKNAKLAILIEAGEAADTVKAFGSQQLTLTHPTDMVVRKSKHVCSRTLAIQADKAAGDLSKELVEKLKNPEQKVRITFIVDF